MTGILTDSTCDLPADLISKFNISVLPMKIKINNENFLDGVTLTSDLFYRQIASSTSQPETEPPSVDEFIARYTELLIKYDEIISIHVGSSFSKTVQNASEAVHQGQKQFFAERLKAKQYNPFKIRVIDSKNVSVGVGLLVYKAAMMMKKEIAFSNLADIIEDSAPKVRLIFTPKDLTYLNRSKRLTGFKYFIANLAGLKPLIQVTNGTMDKFSTVRGFDHAADAIVAEIYSGMKNSSDFNLAVAYAGMKSDMGGNILSMKLSDSIKSSPGYFESIIGSTIGAHCGPETVGAAFLAG